MADDRNQKLPGLDLDVVGAFLRAEVDPHIGECTGQVIVGGKSNMTYLVGDGRHQWIVRRPPLGHVLETAHDMGREARVMSALAPTAVPVPQVLAVCTDPGLIGAPFYVMEYVPGTAFRDESELRELGAARTRKIAEEMIDVLADLHAVDPSAVGLGELGRPEGFLGRQVSRWSRQLDASRSRELAGAEELRAALAARVPTESAARIVHGDYRLDNLLVDESGVRAVIDWEMATIGDPLTDLALLVVYGRVAEIPGGEVITTISRAPGHPSAAQLVERYAARTGPLPPAGLGFYLGLAAFKLAVILEGIHLRHSQGHTVGAGFDTVGALVEPLFGEGIALLKEWS
ncbi:phosphotransferase family protein [Streptomyces sp. LHD-70]|uniref:phosphotransferase family protein n=1 Tax=Streptomyces sp. LHD-70 TaxID=3072140 RepID=UPI00280F2734|nr:phosphotransferase family protein [Streptomyces sp. LHD-70]MDQ8704053.1 phosphotransferase family protein [Streptomyces sp. LHD-70]